MGLNNTKISTLPDNLTVNGNLYLNYTQISTLPDNLTVMGDLYLHYTQISTLPDNLTVMGNLNLNYTQITTLPDNLTVNGWLDLSRTAITTLRNNLIANSLRLEPELFKFPYAEHQGAEGRTIFAVKVNGINAISAGCFLGSIEEFCEQVDKKYNNSKLGEDYKATAVRLINELKKNHCYKTNLD